ncbi:MAG: hypothetical protein Q7T93_18785 [Methylobacterium sp.]|jgi:hypothetical protein|uniref:hypothetical protein n=1 Tax=unclassified Methylobacterium TaxID=2615210 RepID=UPI0006F960CF|nr:MULTISPECIES: hypothetical protein [unclassified Methylobacterium]KQP11288.1 hypothetical protein ASF28_09655 [Methylobacterium sp. Leaf99]MDO9428860.1 hypothetical protein [Methylobacterium sp.]
MIGQRGFLYSVTGTLVTGLLAGAGILAGPGAAQAQQGVFMRDALSNIGLIEPEKPAITYRERAPLVMPPKFDGKALPPPRKAEASPQWPKDPEIAQRERERVEARKPIVRGAQGRMDDNNMTLSIDEMRGGRRADAQVRTEPGRPEGETADRNSFWSNPFGLRSDAVVEPSLVEPDRDVLTDPPTGYRKPPRKVAKSNGDPVNNPSREREEADPGAYIRNRN